MLRREALRPRMLGALALVLAHAVGGEARADESGAALASELFRTGRALEAKGDYAGACAKFAESAKLDPRVGTFAQLAGCDERLDHMVDARVHWQEARDLARRLHDARLEHAAQELARVDAVVPKLLLSLAGPPPADLVITVDSTELSAASLGVTAPVEPGPHTVRATATGKLPFAMTVVTKRDGAVTPVAIELVDEPVSPPPASATPPGMTGQAPAPPAERPPAHAAWSGQKTAALLTGGAGLVGLGVGVYFGVQAASKWSDAQRTCGSACPAGSPGQSLKSDADSGALVSTVGFVAGGALILGAAILWASAPKDAPRTTVYLSPGIAPGVAVLGIAGPFR